jgi:hypothetical protein
MKANGESQQNAGELNPACGNKTNACRGGTMITTTYNSRAPGMEDDEWSRIKLCCGVAGSLHARLHAERCMDCSRNYNIGERGSSDRLRGGGGACIEMQVVAVAPARRVSRRVAESRGMRQQIQIIIT